ncbi:MAG: DUF5320 domain-containing protein [Peptococcaceae bacterium]
MPGFNSGGPLNAGPMTGKGRGYCIQEIEAGSSADDFAFAGRGSGRGFGRGRGMRCWGLPLKQNRNQSKALLKDRATFLRQELKRVEDLLEDEETNMED